MVWEPDRFNTLGSGSLSCCFRVTPSRAKVLFPGYSLARARVGSWVDSRSRPAAIHRVLTLPTTFSVALHCR
jgi:hypothetical protein